jgi:mannose-6-phosphate isomerase-like protein (cupin superfamily)
MSNSAWQVFDVDTLTAQMSDKPVEYKEFLRVPTVSCGLYRLAAGSRDMQTPHDEDEMYVVLEGRAQLQVGDEVYEVKPGSVLYVQAAEAHSFFEIVEDMTLLVVFPAS